MPSTDFWEKLEIKYITSLPSAELAKSVVKVKIICQTGGSLDDNIIAYLISATSRDIKQDGVGDVNTSNKTKQFPRRCHNDIIRTCRPALYQ